MARRKKRRYYDPLAPLPLDVLDRLLGRTVDAEILPARQEINRARRENRGQALLEQGRARDSAAGVAELLRGIAPEIQGDYQAASGAQAAFGKGLGTLQNQIQQADASSAGDFLRRIVGANENQIAQVQSQGQGVGDTSYALGGQIPADMLNQQGAAFTASARHLPAWALASGQRESEAIGKAKTKKEDELDLALKELYDKVPGLRSKAYQDIMGLELQKEAARTQRDYLGVAQNKESFDQQYDVAKLQSDANESQTKQTSKVRENRTKAFASARDDAYDQASRLMEGKKVEDPTSLSGTKIVRPTFQQAYNALYNQFGKPLLGMAPKGQQKWWKRQIDAMIRKAIETAELASQSKLTRPKKKTKAGSWKSDANR